MLFEANVIELKTKIVQIRTNTAVAAYLMMKNAPKAYNLAQQYMCCIENNVTTLPKAYNELMGGVRETKGFVWATVQKYRMYWSKRDTIKEYWRTHATDPKELEMCNKTDWVEGYNGKPTQKKSSVRATPTPSAETPTPSAETPTPSVEIARLQGVIASLNKRLTVGISYLDQFGRPLTLVELPKEPVGAHRDGINAVIANLIQLKHHLMHGDAVAKPNNVLLLE